ncbi:MAG: carbohydrate-binding family 9-like protein [Deltaproteobacteria bacterium]|nr:carbohydrate-binding family 9-like protein [Deltaproteobacteria bacterium]
MTNSKPLFVLLALAVAGLGFGCVEKSRDLTRSERERLEPYVTEEDTDPEHDLNVEFEDKIELIGYDLSSETWRPGQTLTITWHWKVKRSLEEGWRLFTHVTDASGANRVNADVEGVVRELYQPGAWKAGETIKDEQTITLPAEWTDERASVYVGLWNGPHRLRITSGPSDGENRARGLTIPTPRAAGGAEAPPEPTVPSIDVNRASDITIDGKLDEPSWRSARATAAFVKTMDGSPADFGVTAKLLWDDENLYVGFVVDDDYLKSEFDERDDHLWEQDTVEVMLDPGGDGRNYFELQVSPQNVVFDTRYDTRRNPGPIGHADWNAEIESAVEVEGTVNDDDEDEGYTVEMAISWSSFATGNPPATKPEAGQVWRANLYVMDAREEGSRAAGWSPPNVGDFHVPNRFGNLRFVDPTVARQPGPNTGAAAAPSAMGPAQIRLPPGVAERLQRPTRNVVPNEADERRVNRPQAGEVMPTAENPRPGQ